MSIKDLIQETFDKHEYWDYYSDPFSVDNIVNPEANEYYKQLKDYVSKNIGDSLIPISISMEFEISTLNDEDKQAFIKDLNIKESGLDTLIKATYKILGLETFFTYGKKETRA